MTTLPLDGIRVLDFSTLLPGPLAGLILGGAGAEVIKVERPGHGDEMRTYVPKFGEASANFALLNRGKRSIALDLKDESDRDIALALADEADVVIEQFRPGVMARLGLGYEVMSARRPGLVYCSITGYGQDGPSANRAGHDLNYLAEAGVLSLTEPALPPVLIADIAGGAYPAVMNIAFALLARERSGAGAHLDISMTDNLYTLTYWALAEGFAAGAWPKGGDALVTGASPRYNVYPTADGRALAVAPLEDRFWGRFCELVDLPEAARDDATDPVATAQAVADRVASRTAAQWDLLFDGEDVCCAVVRTLDEALRDAHLEARGVFAGRVTAGDREMPALPLPLTPQWRPTDPTTYPELGGRDASWSPGQAGQRT